MNQFNRPNRNEFLSDIRKFHEKFDLGYEGPPRDLRLTEPYGAKLQKFRRNFINEEYLEFVRAEAKEDAAEELDACVDMMYVILGYCYLRGWDVGEAWDRVHRSNMTKERVPANDQRARSPWDVCKPIGFKPPDLSDLV